MASQSVYITGTAGTGKSTLCHELQGRGYSAFDMGDAGLCEWRNTQTNEVAKYPNLAGQEWVDNHKRFCNIEKLTTLRDSVAGTFILTGIAMGNYREYASLFDVALLLQCPPKTLLRRLQTRENNNFAKTKSEQQRVLEKQEVFDASRMREGAVPISSDQALEALVNEVIDLVEKTRHTL